MSSAFVNSRRDLRESPLPALGLGLEINDETLTVLSGLVGTACSSVAGCTAAGLSLLRGSDEVKTAAATSESARTLDGAQYRAGDGPCQEAIRTRAPVVVEDLTTDPRWPAIGDQAKTADLRSVLSLPATAGGHLFGALNLYASDVGVFDPSAHQPWRCCATPPPATTPDNGPDALCDMIIDTLASASSADDMAVLAVQIPSPTVRTSQ